MGRPADLTRSTAEGVGGFGPAESIRCLPILVANAMPPTPPAVHCVLCGRCTVENSHEHGRNARLFFDSFLICCVLCTRCMTKNNRLQRRNSRQFFHETSLARWVLCGRFATKKCDLHGRNSRQFFSETTFGLPSRFHPIQRSHDILL